jgi:hypothetical protein
VSSLEYFRNLTLTAPRYPAEIALIRRAVNEELAKLSEAQALLSSLEVGIQQFEKVLTRDDRNENEIQKCLTSNPILFGLDYREIIPKHKLGSEYEMDYALRRVSGLFDLLELESSSLPLFNKKGDPSQHLVHAEQQVLDWIGWIERHNPYARSKLPGITVPTGYIVIGRANALHNAHRDKLLQRNAVFRDQVRILTYDDVLDRARTIKAILTGSTGLCTV